MIHCGLFSSILPSKKGFSEHHLLSPPSSFLQTLHDQSRSLEEAPRISWSFVFDCKCVRENYSPCVMQGHVMLWPPDSVHWPAISLGYDNECKLCTCTDVTLEQFITHLKTSHKMNTCSINMLAFFNSICIFRRTRFGHKTFRYEARNTLLTGSSWKLWDRNVMACITSRNMTHTHTTLPFVTPKKLQRSTPAMGEAVATTMCKICFFMEEQHRNKFLLQFCSLKLQGWTGNDGKTETFYPIRLTWWNFQHELAKHCQSPDVLLWWSNAWNFRSSICIEVLRKGIIFFLLFDYGLPCVCPSHTILIKHIVL